jgi:hypothetical protein
MVAPTLAGGRRKTIRHRSDIEKSTKWTAQMDGTNGLKETTRVTAPVASNTLSVNIFTSPGIG